MQTSINENRDLDLFFAMLQERARAIKARISGFDLFRNLPQEITINILSRLPIESIMKCKVVCKAWRDRINSPEFGNDCHSYLVVFPKTSPYGRSKYDGTYGIYPRPYKIEGWNNSPIPILHMDLFESVPLGRNSVNGLILLLRREWTEQQQQQQQRVLLWVCNPITREYVTIPNPPDGGFGLRLPWPPAHRYPGALPQENVGYNFGFGLSRASMQYKVVWISQSECQVYTLGTTGGWRSIAASGPSLLRYNKWNTECAFVGGNLYWLDPPGSPTQTEISCFDLETEVFTYFCAPPTRGDLQVDCCRSLCVLDECLCLCDVYGDEIEIWLMRGREWSKKIAINEQGRCGEVCYSYLFPFKDDGNGGMLLGARCNNSIYCYSNDNGTRRRIRRLYPRLRHSLRHAYPRVAVYTPSFLPLRTLLVDEDVRLWNPARV